MSHRRQQEQKAPPTEEEPPKEETPTVTNPQDEDNPTSSPEAPVESVRPMAVSDPSLEKQFEAMRLRIEVLEDEVNWQRETLKSVWGLSK